MLLLNSLMYIVARALPAGLGFSTTMLLTWLLTPAEYGTYGLGLAIIGMASSMFFSWLPITFLRFHENQQSSGILLPTFARLFAGACSCMLVFFGLAWLTGLMRGSEALLAVALVGSWCYAAFDFTSRIQVAELRPVRYLCMNLLRNGSILVVSSATAYFTQSALPVLVVMSGCILAAAALYPIRIRSPGTTHFDRELARSVLRFGLPILLTMTLFGLYASSSSFMLGALAGSEAVGYFTVAYALASGSIGILGSAVDAATYSVCVRALESGDKAAFREQVKQTWSLLIGFGLPASVGLSLVGPDLVRLVVSPPFVPAVVQLVPWMAVAILLDSIRSTFFERGLQLAHRTPQQVWIMLGAAATNVGLNFVLIPRYGFLGAGVASAMAAAVSLVHSVIASRLLFPMAIPARATAKVILATGLMATVVYMFPQGAGVSAMTIEIVFGMATYAFMLLALNFMGTRKQLLGV